MTIEVKIDNVLLINELKNVIVGKLLSYKGNKTVQEMLLQKSNQL